MGEGEPHPHTRGNGEEVQQGGGVPVGGVHVERRAPQRAGGCEVAPPRVSPRHDAAQCLSLLASRDGWGGKGVVEGSMSLVYKQWRVGRRGWALCRRVEPSP